MAVIETPGSTTRGAAYTTEGSTKRLKSIRVTVHDAQIHASTRAIARKPSTANAAPVRRLRSGVSITAGPTFGDQNGTSRATRFVPLAEYLFPYRARLKYKQKTLLTRAPRREKKTAAEVPHGSHDPFRSDRRMLRAEH